MLMMAKTMPGVGAQLSGGPAALTPADVFATSIYTGNGLGRTFTPGINLSGRGGLVWGKNRDSGANPHSLFDTIRGGAYELVSNSTAGQAGPFGVPVTFSTTGFFLPNAVGNNISGVSSVAWALAQGDNFLKIATTSHTNGSATNISLSVLGTIGLALAKRTDSTGDWLAVHRSLTSGNNLRLQTTAAESVTNAWLSISGTTLTISSSATTGTYVIYGFAHDSAAGGIIQCGDYAGNASTNGPDITLGWQPQFLMVKCITTTGSWFMVDSARGADNELNANNDFEENSNFGGGDIIDFQTNGFKLKTSNTALNGSSRNYAYMAIRAAA